MHAGRRRAFRRPDLPTEARSASTQFDAAFGVFLTVGSAVTGALLASAGFLVRAYGEFSLSALLASGSLPFLPTASTRTVLDARRIAGG